MGCVVLTSTTDHAVSASTVYLVRSLGTVWGVSVTSAIVQTTLTTQLLHALRGIPYENDVRAFGYQGCRTTTC